MKTKIWILMGLVAGCSVVHAWAASPMAEQKKRYARFEKLMEKDDLAGAERELEAWQTANPDDAELAVALGNYYVARGAQPLMLYRGERNDTNVAPGHGESFQLTAADGTTGFLDGRPRCTDEAITSSVAVLRKAVSAYPHRLDIRMGAAHLQLVNDQLDGAFQSIHAMADYARENPAKLRWRYNEKLEEEPSTFVPAKLHSYALQFYEKETTAGLEYLLKIAQLAQKLYPEHPYAYNDEAAYYNSLGDDKKALDALLRAHKASPKDAIVTLNIAASYNNLKKPEKAREFYEKTVKIADDEELKEAAREALKELQKKPGR